MMFQLAMNSRALCAISKTVFLSFVLQVLSGCVPLVVGGAVIGGSLWASDRRTSGAQLEDEGIELRSASRLREALAGRGHINVTSFNRQVLLTGEVPSEADKVLVQQITARVENVKTVFNEVEVLGNSTLASRSSDSLVTTRVKANLVDSKDLYANAFKIVTERGIVYVMGRVTPTEASKATEVIRSTSGVQRVVRVLELITEDELKNTLPQPAKTDGNARPAGM